MFNRSQSFVRLLILWSSFEVQNTFPRKIVLHLILNVSRLKFSQFLQIMLFNSENLLIWLLLPGQLHKNSVQTSFFSKFSNFSAQLPPEGFNSNEQIFRLKINFFNCFFKRPSRSAVQLFCCCCCCCYKGGQSFICCCC